MLQVPIREREGDWEWHWVGDETGMPMTNSRWDTNYLKFDPAWISESWPEPNIKGENLINYYP